MITPPLLGVNWIEPHGGEERRVGGEDRAVFSALTQPSEAGASQV